MHSTDPAHSSSAASQGENAHARTSPTAEVFRHRSAPGREWLSQIAPLWFARRWLAHPERLVVRRYTTPIAGLSKELEGLRIAHLTDLHLGRCVGPDYVRAVVDRALALKPDIFALTGDYVENAHSPLDLMAELLAPLADRSRNGAIASVAVLGNHDWYAGSERVAGALRGAGLTVIDNARVHLGRTRELIDGATQPNSLCIAGFGDLGHDDTRPFEALGGADPDTPRLVLAHHPDTAEERVFSENDALRIDLMLSGHTHGGQIQLPLIGSPIVPSRYGRKYLGGLVQGPAFRVLISRGAGMTMLPFRVGVPPEISEITLVRAHK